ncbi:hypothetical protein [Micromonospora eburnea]|uniref:Uncharacterized protein n=1 Tax=Micromonospora eburnea TaxID=227316 RepID=A0A1C6U6W7_9ACTN|nr:hypothetical protein [Micromonospora eburnea]SCL49835.1 hypothetical protein GA0070604_1995 [Micromonospora eburnea]
MNTFVDSSREDREAPPPDPDGPVEPPSDPDEDAPDSTAALDGDGVDEDLDEEPLDPLDVIGRLSALLGAPSGIGVGDVHVRGQNATGTGATAIGTLNVTMAGAGGGRTWSELLSGMAVRHLADGYAVAPSDQQLDRRLKQRSLVCLSGQNGSGRYTAACLASARRHGYDRVGLLNAESPADLIHAAGALRPGHGYVLRLDEAGVRELDGMTLVGLATRVEAATATVVLVGDFLRRDEFAAHLVEHQSPAAADVFRAQLRQQLRSRCVGGCGDGCARRCVDLYVEDECATHPLLLAYLNGGPRPGEVARVVDLIAQHPVRGAELTQRLERLLPRQLRERAGRILDCADSGTDVAGFWTDADRRAFRISCAVLAGQPVVEIHQAARLLAAPDLPGAVPNAGPSGRAGAALDSLLGPTLRQAVLVMDDDRLPAGRRIEFAPGNDALRAALLDVAWEDWWLPEQLLRWWSELARDGMPGVRQAAAGAIGWSAGHGVQHALRVVDQLARERRASVRQAAAIALVAMAMQPPLRQRIRAELDGWAAGGAAHLRDTVARAYALGLARLWPDAALVQLRQVAQARMQRWQNSVVRGLVQVYEAGHAPNVMAALAEWTASPEPEVRLHAGRAMRILADRWSPAPREHWPELLDLARGGTVSLTDLATCWAGALALPGTAYRTWRTLGFWLNRADGHPEVAAYCLKLLSLVVDGREPLRRRLDHQLRHVWGPLMPHNTLLDDVRRLTDEDHP